MKTRLYSILLTAILAIAGHNALAQGSNLQVVIKNIKNAKGEIRVGLFNNEETFLKTPMDGKIVSAVEGSVTVVFSNILPGEYAISVVHDANKNGKLDYTSLGIPKEGVAFGNNAVGSFGPPAFDKAKVNLSGQDLSCTLEMKYY
ncbi:MAG TPA: DUF2141 domain-containing protein [Chryseolinea sp.]